MNHPIRASSEPQNANGTTELVPPNPIFQNDKKTASSWYPQAIRAKSLTQSLYA